MKVKLSRGGSTDMTAEFGSNLKHGDKWKSQINEIQSLIRLSRETGRKLSGARLGFKSVIGELCQWSGAGVAQPVPWMHVTVARGDGGCLVSSIGRNNAQLPTW